MQWYIWIFLHQSTSCEFVELQCNIKTRKVLYLLKNWARIWRESLDRMEMRINTLAQNHHKEVIATWLPFLKQVCYQTQSVWASTVGKQLSEQSGLSSIIFQGVRIFPMQYGKGKFDASDRFWAELAYKTRSWLMEVEDPEEVRAVITIAIYKGKGNNCLMVK